jgi:hypothetical protein
MAVLAGADFFTVEILTLKGLVTFQQESPQSLWVGKALQARQVLKASV